jgi:hypothetical protein
LSNTLRASVPAPSFTGQRCPHCRRTPHGLTAARRIGGTRWGGSRTTAAAHRVGIDITRRCLPCGRSAMRGSMRMTAQRRLCQSWSQAPSSKRAIQSTRRASRCTTTRAT